MRTIEEVKKHLETVYYGCEVDRYGIIGFLAGKGIITSNAELRFMNPKINTMSGFISWFEDEEHEAVDNEADKIISEIEELLKKKGFTSITINAEPSDEVCKTALDFCKEQKMMALEELERSEKQLEEKIADMSDERMKGMATKILNFAKELKEEVKKKINE